MSNEDNLISGRRKIIAERLSVKHAFILAVTIGSLGIFFGVFFHSALLSVVFPLLVMAGYIILVDRSAPDLPKSTIGDSYYYLGFIFTLISLAASLISLSSSDGINMNSIIGSFGAALSTTIVGLVARLFITAFSVEARVRRERLETEVEKSLTQFTEQLDLLTTLATSSLTNVHAKTESTLSETLSKYEKINSQVSESFRSSIKEGSENIKTAFDGLASRINQIQVKPDAISTPLESALAGLIATIEDHQTSYQKLNQHMVESNNSLSKQLSQSNTIITGHISTFEAELVKALDKQSKSYGETLEDIASSILGGLGVVKGVKMDVQSSANAELEKLRTEISGFTDTINEWHGSISGALQNLDGITELSTNNADLMSTGAARLEKATLGFSDSLDSTSEIKTSLEDVVSTIRELNVHLGETVRIGQAANSKMESAANATEQASNQVASDIADIYSSLARQLKSLREAA